jgi:hypothetical protein
MSSETEPKPDARRSAAGDFIPSNTDEVSILADQTVDKLMHVVIALGAELWTTRRRQMTLEAVMAKVGVTSEDVEKYVPSDAEKAAWSAERDIFIKRTFSALERVGDANPDLIDLSETR